MQRESTPRSPNRNRRTLQLGSDLGLLILLTRISPSVAPTREETLTYSLGLAQSQAPRRAGCWGYRGGEASVSALKEPWWETRECSVAVTALQDLGVGSWETSRSRDF